MCDALSEIDESIVEWFFKYEECSEKQKHANYVSKFILVAACFTVIIAVAILSLLNRTFSISDLEPIRMPISGNASFSSTLSPYPSDGKRIDIDIEDAEKMLGSSVEDIFKENDVIDFIGFILEDKNGALHTVSFTFVFENGFVHVTIDPNSYPKNILDSNKTEKINGYKVGRLEYYVERVDNYEVVSDLTDMIIIGMKNDNFGIRLMGKKNLEPELEHMYNYILKKSNAINYDV